MASASRNKLSVKLMFDKKRNILLYAEAEKSFVDFIFHIVGLPIGAVIQLFSNTCTVGSLGTLYNGIQTLSDTYFWPSDSKNGLLSVKKAPTISSSADEILKLFKAIDPCFPAFGYVKTVSYMVMDNLVVCPLLSTSIVTLMKQLEIKDMTQIEERVVDVGFEECVQLLKASMVSTTVLTDVFLGGEKKGNLPYQPPC